MNQTRIKPPCFKCAERKVGCHSSCEKYASFSKELGDIKDKRMKEFDRESMLVDYEINMKIKYKTDHMKIGISKYKGGKK